MPITLPGEPLHLALLRRLRRLIAHGSLRWALTVPFVLLIVMATTLVGYLSYQSGQTAVENLGHQLVAESNGRVTEKLETYLQTPFLINRLNVDAVDQGQLDLQDTAALESALFHRLQQFDQVSAILFASPAGQFRVVEQYPDWYLAAADPSQPNLMQVYRLDQAGRRGALVATNDNFDVRRDRPWYREAEAAGQPIWSTISRYGTLEALTLSAAQPVYEQIQNRLLGVFAVHLRLDYLSQFLHRLEISRTGQILITDAKGALVATSTEENPYQLGSDEVSGAFNQLRLDQSQDSLTRSLGQYLRARPEILAAGNQPQFLEFRYDNQPHYVQITPFQDRYGLNLRIITLIPKSHFLQAIQDSTQTTVLLCLLTLAIAIGLGLFAANRLTARFVQIDRVSRQLALGKLDQRLPTTGWIAELNDLSQTYNQMADQLQRSFEQIKAALAESEEKFTTIFRTSPEPIGIVSLAEGTILEVNESLLRFFGYSEAEIVGRTALDLNLWNSLEQRDQYRVLLKQGSIRNLEVQLRTKSGEVKTSLLSAEVRRLEGQDRIIVMHRDISERKAAELALQQSESRYRAIVEDQTELICCSRPDTTLTFVNDAYCRYFGVGREQILGQSYRQFIYQPDHNAVFQEIGDMDRQHPVRTIENRVLVNGQVRWMQWSDRLLFDQQGNVTEIQAVGRDITDLKQTEAALRKSEASLLQAQRIAHLGSWELDPATQKLTWSEELFRIVGLDPAQTEPARTELMAMIPAEDREILEAAVERAIADGTPYELEHRLCRQDGTVRYLVSKGQALVQDGRTIKLYGTALDITERTCVEAERRRAEMALQASEARFQEIAQTINQVFYVISATTGQYLYISPAYERLWGHSCASLYENPTSWLDRIYPEDLKTVLQGMNQLFSGSSKRLQYRIICANGEVRWIESESLIVQDEAGNPLRVVGLADDITERKRLERSLRSQAEEAQLLATITQTIRQSLDLEQILSTTVAEVQQTLQADRVLIFRLNSDGSGQVIQEAVVSDYPVSDQLRWQDEHFPQECYAYYQQGQPRIVPNVATDDWANCLAEFLQEMGVKSKVVAPIVQVYRRATPRVWGLLVVHACAYRRSWQESEANFLQKIANQLAIAIEQASLYQKLQIELAERRQTEQALQEREAMLRAIGDNLPRGFIYQVVYEPEKNSSYYTYISAGIERLLGLKPADVLQNSELIRTIGFEEDLARADRIVQESLPNLTPIEIQMRNQTATGEVQWSAIREIPRQLADGRIVWDGVEVDITDLKRTEAALRISEERFRRAFDDAPIGVSLVAPSGQFLQANHYYCDLLGYTEAELLELTFQELTHPADLAVDLEGARQVLAGELRSFQMEKRYITKQGAAVPVVINIALVRDQAGQPLYFIGYTQDMRDRLKVERMRDEFISIVSHELRTPLTSIRGALGILSSGVFSDRPEQVQKMLRIANSNSERLSRLINDILSLERLESGKAPLVMEHCQVADLIQQAVDSVQAVADQSAVSLCSNACAATLWAAPDAIVQTLTNLLSNAIKFSSPGATVWVEARPQEGAIQFAVQDHGRGIPADKLEIIFEQFQQVDASDSRKRDGTGLGLAICRKIVQEHGGQIWAESLLGQGSSFYFTLPNSIRPEQ